MKNLHLLRILFLLIIVSSCNKDDDSSTNAPAGEPGFQATLNGGTYSNYTFNLGAYEITSAANGTLSLDMADINGNMITLFLNGTDGFGSGVVKQMGNIDSNDYMTHSVIRQSQQVTYFSSSGNVTITNNREHPTEAGKRLITGTFEVTAETLDEVNETTMTGTFNELEYTE